MNTNYKSHAVRSPFQPHPVKRMQERTMDTQDAENPIRVMLEKLCQSQYSLSATFSPATGIISTLKTPGLVAVECTLSMDGKPIGIGHGSTVISRFNKSLDRALYSCLNGSLMSAINSACKTLDVIRLEGTQEQSTKRAVPGEAYRAVRSEESQLATDKQKSYLRELILNNADDDTDRQQLINQLGTLTKDEASKQIELMVR